MKSSDDIASAQSDELQYSIRYEQARAVAEDVLARRNRGEVISDEQVVTEYPQLVPEIYEQLQGLKLIREAVQAALKAGPVQQKIAIINHDKMAEPIELSKQDADSLVDPSFDRPRISGFQILNEIGRGGQGIVFRAVQEVTGRHVAIKVITGGALIDSRNRSRLDREVRILASLNHPHLVGIVDRGRTADGAFYLAMEYVDGLPLEDYAAECALQDVQHPQLLFKAIAKVARALHAAHLSGVMHRDIKPSNIRIDRYGEPRILDFGLAHSSSDGTQAVTMTGQWIGSLPWFSPEQAKHGDQCADAQTDLYALGVVTYQLLTEQFPYDTTGPVKRVLDRIEHAIPAPPSSVTENKLIRPNAVDAVVLKVLAKDKAKRYANAKEFSDDLEAVVASRSPEALRSAMVRFKLAIAASLIAVLERFALSYSAFC